MEDLKYKNDRSLLLDCLRGFTVVLMIIFHFSFDLDYFGFVKFDIINHPFWYFFPRLIVFLFLFTAGMALQITHKNGMRWKNFLKRLALLIFWALVISLVTYFFFPENWIYFGTLHAIAVVSVFSLPFLKRPLEALIVGLCLFIPSIIYDQTLPWISLPHTSWDYISPFPWMGASLIGIFAAHKALHTHPIPKNKLTKSLNYLGKHSLFIYLIHQPILFGLLMLIAKLKHS